MFHQYQAYVPFYFNDNNNKSRKQLPGPFSLEWTTSLHLVFPDRLLPVHTLQVCHQVTASIFSIIIGQNVYATVSLMQH